MPFVSKIMNNTEYYDRLGVSKDASQNVQPMTNTDQMVRMVLVVKEALVASMVVQALVALRISSLASLVVVLLVTRMLHVKVMIFSTVST